MNQQPTNPIPCVRPNALTQSSAHIAVVARPSVARTGYLLQHVAHETRNGRSVLVVDFGSDDSDTLAASSSRGRVVVVDADTRGAILPLGSLDTLPEDVSRCVHQIFLGWLSVPGHAGESRIVREALDFLAALPLIIPRVGLYIWYRFLIDRTYRRNLIRDLRGRNMDPTPLLAIRPGTTLWDLVEERVRVVLGHDDTLDRVFPIAEPGILVEPSEGPEVRIIQMKESGAKGAGRFPLLVWFQVLAAVYSRPMRRRDGRCHVGRLLVIEPPPSVWACAEISKSMGLPMTIATSDTRARYPLEAWFPQSPALVLQRAIGVSALSKIGALDPGEARRIHAATEGLELLFVHQRGVPADRWCAVQSVSQLPTPVPGARLKAREDGKHRFLVDRQEVVYNRKRLEAQVERRNRRSMTGCLLERAASREQLTASWHHVRKNDGVHGTDGQTVSSFADQWQQNLTRLTEELLGDRYRPRLYLRAWKDKTSGGRRPIAIASVRDRVVMGAFSDVLSSVLDSSFSDRSFAYRPGRGAHDAVNCILGSSRLEVGYALVSDIASYFDSVEHRVLLGMLREHVADERFVRVVASWLANPSRDQGVDTRPRRGLPQGSPISPVLANLYLTPLDRWMERNGLDYARYADDFVAICDSESQARAISDALEKFLAAELGLSIKPSKTSYVSLEQGFDFLGFYITSKGADIQGDRLTRAVSRLDTLLGQPITDPIEVLKQVDAFVRGFRNYFDLNTKRTTTSLLEIERLRRDKLETWARARRLDVKLVVDRAERFVSAVLPEGRPLPGAYAYDGSGALEIEPSDLVEDEVVSHAVESGPPTSLLAVDRRPSAVKRRLRPHRPMAVDAGGHLGIFGFGAYAGVSGERVTLKRKGEEIFEAPLNAFRSVHIESYGMAVSTTLLEELAKRSIPVVLSKPGGQTWAVCRPLVSGGNVDILQAQLTAHTGRLSVDAACALISAKIDNQERLLRYYAKAKIRRTSPVGAALRDAASRMRQLGVSLSDIIGDDVAALRRKVFSIEGRAGAAYWTALRMVLGDEFSGRIGRGAKDPINMALNYGYGVLYAATWAAVGRSGLDPGIGMLHASTGNRGALVFDMVEPFRVPAVDRPIIGLLSRGKRVKVNKDGYLTASARRDVATAVGEALSHPVPWGGVTCALGEHLDRHASDLALWLQGGRPLRALRIRW